MEWIASIPATWAATLLLVAARLAGVFLVAPVFGDRAVPVRLRVAMSLAVALAVAVRLGAPAAAGSLPALLPAVAGEAAIGLAIGLAARLLLVGVELAALQLATQMGITLAEVFDPFWAERGVLRRLFQVLAVVVFLSIGGHRALLAAVLGTFEGVPLATAAAPSQLVTLVTGLLAAGWLLALKVAAPALAALLIATVALALLQRAAVQCNVLSIGLPIRPILTLAVLAATLGVLPGLLEAAWTGLTEQIAAALGGG